MANNSICVEYNQELKPLEELLAGVKRAGNFIVRGVLELPMPRVEVEGVGVLSFPVPLTQIAALIQQATRAPYGRGAETILDESVRKVWQLPPDTVRLGGKSWPASFKSIVEQVIAGLGVEGMGVSAELYKLLVYETGGFFLAHRDTEKADGMFGTLVVVLPSAHGGGELLIRHAGREAVVDLSGAEVSEVTFAAFYADCEHEVRPITDGNRVCLVYNLIQERDARGKDESLRAPDYEKQVMAAAALLEEELSEPGAAAKIAWLLEHQYSPDGLAFSGLKAADAARVKVLAQAAERAGCVAHLGIVHIEESGSAEPEYDSYRSRRWGRHYNDEKESEGASVRNFEVIEVSDGRHYVSQWRDLHDEPVEFGEIPLAPGELLPAGALDDEKPDEQRLMEASGNEGATFARSYHRAALVIWRRERYAEVLLQAGVAAVLPYFKERIEACDPKSAPPAARQEAVALAQLLVRAWQDAPEFAAYGRPSRPDKRDVMLRLLNRLGEVALLEEFIAEVVTRDYNGSENAALVACVSLLGAESAGRLFSELVGRHLRHRPGACIDLLDALARSSPSPPRGASVGKVGKRGSSEKGASSPRPSPPLRGSEGEKPPHAREAASQKDWQSALRQIAEAAVSKLDEIGKKQANNEWADWRRSEQARAVDAAFVVKLLDVLGELHAPALRAAAVAKLAADPTMFDPVTVLVPGLALIREWDDAVTRLWDHSAEFLLQRSGRPPEAPQDWRQDVKLSCSCAECRELRAFTLDPVEQTHRFRVRQDRRMHLEHQIRSHPLDMTHVTDRKGSPQTLVCTKDRRTYKRRCEQYRQDIAALATLAELAAKTRAATASLKNIEAARALAARWSPA